MKKRMLSILMALVMVIGLMPVTAFAAEISSTTGNVYWEIEGGTLTIYGEGEMGSYTSGNAPWDAYKKDITTVVIKEGVTNIGNSAFYGCSSLTAVTIPASVESIGNYAFYNCSCLTTVRYNGTSEPTARANTFDGTAVSGVSVPAGYEGNTFAGMSVIKQEIPETIKVTGVSLDKDTLTLTAADETATLTATVTPDNATDSTVTWISSNEAVATVSDGVVTAVANGEAIITVTTMDGSFTATCTVTVNIPPATVDVTGVTLDATTVSLETGKTATLTATVSPEGATDKTVTWTSSDTSVATVDENGVITAVGAGTAIITAQAGDVTATCEVTVKAASSGKKTKKYDVVIKQTDNGDIEVDDDYAKRGQEITITVDPDKDYELDELTIIDIYGEEVDYNEGKKDNTFVFDMPKGDVTIEASFEKVSSADEDDKDKQEVVPDKEEDISVNGGAEKFIKLTIDQKIAWVFDAYVVNDVAPVISNERTMLPIRFIAEALGGDVAWDEAAQTVSITKGDIEMEIYIGQSFALVNGAPVQLDSPAFIENDRTYLPLRFVAENLGAEVAWDGMTQTVTIFPKK